MDNPTTVIPPLGESPQPMVHYMFSLEEHRIKRVFDCGHARYLVQHEVRHEHQAKANIYFERITEYDALQLFKSAVDAERSYRALDFTACFPCFAGKSIEGGAK